MPKYRVMIEVDISEETMKNSDSGACSLREHVERELCWAAQSFDSMNFVDITEVKSEE
jgi:hypothetical protein